MPTSEPEDAVERALTLIRRDQQARRLHRTATNGGTATPSAASSARFRYLDALEHSDNGRAISEIGEAIGVDRPRASRLTTELLKDGLIQRQPHPDDSRYALVRLTAEGTAIVNEMHRTRRDAVARALAGFTPRESRVFADLLSRFVAAWQRQEPQDD